VAKRRGTGRPSRHAVTALYIGVFPTRDVPLNWTPQATLHDVATALGLTFRGVRVDGKDGYRSRIELKKPLAMGDLADMLDDTRLRSLDLGGARFWLGAKLFDGQEIPLSKAYQNPNETLDNAIGDLLDGATKYMDPDAEDDFIVETLKRPRKWKDDAGRWRDARGRYTKAPARKSVLRGRKGKR